MKTIELDANDWSSILDFYNALLAVLGSPDWHSPGIDAMLDSMIWGGINKVEPPYKIKISGADKLPIEVHNEIALLSKHLAEHRELYRAQKGQDVDVTLETIP